MGSLICAIITGFFLGVVFSIHPLSKLPEYKETHVEGAKILAFVFGLTALIFKYFEA